MAMAMAAVEMERKAQRMMNWQYPPEGTLAEICLCWTQAQAIWEALDCPEDAQRCQTQSLARLESVELEEKIPAVFPRPPSPPPPSPITFSSVSPPHSPRLYPSPSSPTFWGNTPDDALLTTFSARRKRKLITRQKYTGLTGWDD